MFSWIKTYLQAIIACAFFLLGAGVSYWMFACTEDIDAAHEAESGLIEDENNTEIIYLDRIEYINRYVEATGNIECLSDDDLRMFNDN